MPAVLTRSVCYRIYMHCILALKKSKDTYSTVILSTFWIRIEIYANLLQLLPF